MGRMDQRLGPGQFFGLLRERRDIPGFVLTEYQYAPRLRARRHAHALPYFCVVLEGGYTEQLGAQERSHDVSTVSFHPAGEEHADHFHGTGARIFSVELEGSWMARHGAPSAAATEPACFRGGPLAALVLRIHREFHQMDDVSGLAIEGLSLEVLAAAWRERAAGLRSGPPVWLRRARELASERCAEPVTLAVLAGEVGVHPMHLVREFRRHYGQTVGEFVRHQRVERSCRRLRESSAPIAAIALEVGFSQQSHFTRVFKRAMGTTPAAYRRATRLA